MHMTEVDSALAEVAAHLTMILVPGVRDSGEEHWQSYWSRRFPSWRRIRQRDWFQADLDSWELAIRRELLVCKQPAILIGHSFGALASCYVVQSGISGVAGVVLVAPAEPLRFELEERINNQPLAVPSLAFASHNDPLMRFTRAEYWARVWGSELVDVGEAGHINAESGFGAWDYGLTRVGQFAKQVINKFNE